MKKIAIFSLCAAAALGATAQTQLVKDAQKAMSSDKTAYPSVIKTLEPAFTNAETAQDAYTWFVAGKGAYDFFDDGQVKVQIKQPVDKKALGHAVIDGFNYMLKALPLDTITDAKGKVKTKYSKDIIKTVNGHYNDLSNAALLLWDEQDYPGAVEAWQIFIDAPQNPTLAKNGLKAAPDSTYAEILFNMGIGNSLAENNEGALKNFQEAIARGYTKKNAYDYGIAAASQLGRLDQMAAIAQQAYEIYGKEDPRYIGYMVNYLIDSKKFAEADALIDSYIAAEPNNAQLHFVKGVLLESEEKPVEALDQYKKAVELDPSNAQAQFRTGYMLYQEAVNIDQTEGGNLSQAEYKKLREVKIDPLFREAAKYIEKAHELDPELNDARTVLRSIYYNLNDEANLKRVEEM